MKKLVLCAILLLSLPAISSAQTFSASSFLATTTTETSRFNGSFVVDGFFGAGTTTQYAAAWPWEFMRETTGGTTNAAVAVTNYDTVFPIAGITLRSAKGTAASPTALTTNNYLGRLYFGGYDGTSFAPSSPAFIGAVAASNWSSGNRGTRFIFAGTPNGTTTRKTIMTLDSDGNLDVTGNINSSGDVSVGGMLTVNGIINTLHSVNMGISGPVSLSLSSGSNILLGTTSPLADATIMGNAYVSNAVLIGSPFSVYSQPLVVTKSGTTTVLIDSSAAQGGCLMLKDSDGSGYTYITVNDGVLSASATPCE